MIKKVNSKNVKVKETKNENNITELVFILDRSGSMGGLEKDTIGGFNSMIEKQKEQDGKCYVTTVLFDHVIETLHDRISLMDIKPMTDKEYFVRGCTALIDAIGVTIKHIEDIHRYQRPEDVPSNTMFVITTDGLENASKEYSADTVRKMIEQKKELGWEFLFIGANIDAVSTARNFGIGADRAVDYHADSMGTGIMYETVCDAVTSVRAKKPLAPSWSGKIKKDHKSRK